MAIDDKKMLQTEMINNSSVIHVLSADALIAEWNERVNNICPINLPSNFSNSNNFFNITNPYNPVSSAQLNNPYLSYSNDPVSSFQFNTPYSSSPNKPVTYIQLDNYYSSSTNKSESSAQTNNPYSSIDYNKILNFSKDNVASNIPTILDFVTLGKLLKDLGLRNGNAILKNVNGRQYVILKGYANSRSILTGTRYLASNPKIVQMAVGTIGLKKAIRSGGMLTIALYVPIEILKFVLDDTATFSSLAGTIATDIIKVGIGTVLAELSALAAGSVTTVAAAPIVVAIGVGVLSGVVLNAIDDHFGLTDKLIAALDEIGDEISKKVESLERKAGRAIHQFEREIIYRAYRFDIDGY